MKIVEATVSEPLTDTLEIQGAEIVGEYALRLTFNTGEQRTVDFGPFLLRHAGHPAIRAYLQEDHFRQFRIINGNVNWNDYDLIFPVADLYAGKIA